MSDLLLIYITCENVEQAKKIGHHLLTKKLCGCVNIYPEMTPMFLWPPRSGKIDESKEVVLIVKTTDPFYKLIEEEVLRLHTFEVPCIIGIPVKYVSQSYYNWITNELDKM